MAGRGEFAAMIAAIGADKPLRTTRIWRLRSFRPASRRSEVRINAYPGESDPGPFPVPKTRRSKAGRRTSDASPPRVPSRSTTSNAASHRSMPTAMGSSSIQRIGSCTSFID
jgi:hypothetical protein